ncbi:PKD domain-containing protein [Tamlana sp. 2_MG-2023]|uniref:PKD domain-containing protein n=1 Tax=unclassified Tamlana TaxID=2614803 RepID=UPI0026E25AC7|nr:MULTISPECIES: PKD domain-containing protein [unclassified Tamlana]MDO6759677.1 PKD domain-containing protein [Tamlana sp. 2_MG-2023]MDO6791300.1 PKD domain-containing protein [Tamlana sp. 1_MG-2023]
MKITKYIFKICLLALMVMGCSEDDNLDYIDNIVAPTNVSAAVSVTQDNTGLVTIIPLGEGVVNYIVNYGDGTVDSDPIDPGKNTQHVYEEGVYDAKITAIGLSGLKTTVTQNITVSFKAPENLIATIENDPAISKQVNVEVSADHAISYEVHFGEPGHDNPVAGNIGETVSYQYQNAGNYTIRIVAMSAAVETLEYTEEFQVTAILQPLAPARKPNKAAQDVISVFSDVYVNPDPIDYYPNWGQTTTYAQIEIDGDNVIQYGDLTYQGIDFSTAPIDASGMEFIHVDVWSAEDYTINISPISDGPNEAAYSMTLVGNQWNSVEIPITHFTDLNPAVDFSNIIQFKFDGVPSGEGTIFVDNLYFYKPSSGGNTGPLPLTFEGGFMLDGFDGGGTSVVANPDTNGNTSENVLEMVKGAGQVWAGSKITIPTVFDFSTTTVTAKVWSPRVGLNLLMKFENNVPWPDVTSTAEVTATTTVANQWETLTFDFSGVDTAIDFYNLVLIMDNGTEGDASANYTIYVDDISTNPMLEFEPDYLLDGFDGGGTSVVANPDTNGNTSQNVLEMVKGAGQVWAGSKITVPTVFDFSTTTVTAKVWSPRVGLNLLMKFEDNVPWPNVTSTAEVTATTTVANQWETLTFDFSGVDTSIDFYNLVLIMDNGTEGDGSANYTIYVDDIAQN